MELRPIILLLFLSSTIMARNRELLFGEDYVRPSSRNALAFPWQSKKDSATGPQQVSTSLKLGSNIGFIGIPLMPFCFGSPIKLWL
jgi:hypothetical protein